jgi:hypothetical protein
MERIDALSMGEDRTRADRGLDEAPSRDKRDKAFDAVKELIGEAGRSSAEPAGEPAKEPKDANGDKQHERTEKTER